MINDEANSCHYFAVKNLPEVNFLEWLRRKKEAIINNNNSFKNALDDVLNCQTIKTNPEEISKLKPYINRYNWKGIELPVGPKDWIKFELNNKKMASNIFFIPHNTDRCI